MSSRIIPVFILAVIFIIFSKLLIQAFEGDQGVTILSRKANEVLKPGNDCRILWKAEPAESEFGTMVTVEFSKDRGKSWEKVEENVPNAGRYSWKVPKVDSSACQVRVFSQYRPIYRGTSEVFAVK